VSGKRQHFVPRFLQRGFASHMNKDEVFTWVYRKDAKPFNTNIVNVGVEGLFYSQDGDNQLDDEITEAEDRYGALIDALRNDAEGTTPDADALAELLAHLEVRTRHLRQNFSSTAGSVVEELLRFIEDREVFGDYIKRRIKNDPSFVRDAMLEEFRKQNIPESLLPLVLRNGQPLLEKMLPSLLSNLPSMTEQFRALLPDLVGSASKAGHIKALKQALAPQIKAEWYRSLNYQVLRSKTKQLPLGDSMLVFQLAGERPYKPFCEKDDPVRTIYLPLSPSQVLVGSVEVTTPDLTLLPMAIARCSLEYFISNANNSENYHLQTLIGKSAHLLSKDQIETLLTEIKND